MPYIGKSPSFGVRNRFVYVASSGATSVSGADANGATLAFTDGAFVDVYLNGVLLKPTTDYNTSTANTIAGLSALNTSDEVTVIVYDVFTVGDMVSATSGGTFSGAVEFASGFTASDGSTITVDDNSDNLTLTSTDADANGGPNLRLYRNSSSPADGDMIGQIDFEGRNDNSQDIVAASIRSVIDDVSDGTEDSRLIFETITGGSAIEPLRFKPGETVFNEGSADIDFRVESDNDIYAFFLNGANGHIGIGSNNADYMGSSNTGGVLSLTVPSGGYSVFELAAEGADSADALAGTINFINTLQTGGNQLVNIRGTTEGSTSADRGGRFTVGTKSDGGSSPSERFRINALGAVKARADGTVTQSDLTDSVHEFATAASAKDIARFGCSNTSYASNGVNIGVTRGSASAYNTLATHHGNDGSDRYADRTFAVDGTGQIASDASTSITSGADYAEYFEWKDGNGSNEDRIGQSVVLDGNKIRKATSDDSASTILGVISGNPSVVGDTAELRWQGKWELDDFNRRQTEEVEIWEWTDPEGNVDELGSKSPKFHSYGKDKVPEGLTVPSDKTIKKVINDKYSSSYDTSKKDDYVPRKDRKEWDAVGLMGKLRMLKGQPTGDRWIKMKDISDTVEEWLVR